MLMNYFVETDVGTSSKLKNRPKNTVMYLRDYVLTRLMKYTDSRYE